MALVVLALVGGIARGDDVPTPFDTALAQWKRDERRAPLNTRWHAMFALASTEDPRALEILTKRYRRPREPKDHERYLLGSLFGQFFNESVHLKPLKTLALKRDDDQDGWMWYHVLRTALRAGEADWVASVAQDRTRNVFVRAAALEALGRSKHAAALSTLEGVLTSMERTRPSITHRLLESGASVLYDLRGEATSEDYRSVARLLLSRTKARRVPDSTRLIVARHLGRAFGVRKLTFDTDYWNRVIEHQTEVARDGHTLARPRFAGLEATGTRIAYLLDMSDSMLEPVAPEIVEKLKVGRDIVDDTRRWGIRTRFDLARELLRASLAQLDPEAFFVVIGFGEEAYYLHATPGLEPAEPSRIRRAMAELDQIPATDRLWHATNMHGAFRKAFQATSGDPIPEYEHVARAGFTEGCDTIFLLSDGKPTCGDFYAMEMADAGTMTRDPESGRTEPLSRRAELAYFCPYSYPVNLLRDLKRLNLFRKVEIHCLGTGEADKSLLKDIAAVGLGSVLILGN